MAGTDIGYYTLPVILSFDGVEKQVTSKLGKAFGDVGKKSSKALADNTEADLKRATDSYEKLRNKAADALGKVRVEEEKLKKAREGGKADQIAAAEERHNKALRDSASASRAAKAGYEDLTDAQRRLGDGTKNLGGHFGNLGDMAGKAGAALSTAGVVAAGAALAGIAALGAGVVVLGRELYDLGQQWDDVTDSIAIKTGKLGPDLEKLKTAVKDLAPSTASSIGQIGSVVGSVSQALRVSGMDLEKTSKTIADLNRLTGEDLNVRDLGKVFRGFGVDAKSQVPALDSLYRVSTATGISVNQLLSAITAAGPAARTMGLDISQTAALLATFDDAGIDGEKALGSLSIAAKNLAKDGKAPAEGLRETLTQIQGLIAAGREPDAINVATKIFGKGYAPILDAIRSGALDAQSLNDALAAGGVTIDQVAQSTADWSERWQQLKNTLSVALEPIATGVFNLVNEKLTGFADWITQNQSKVIGFFGAVADWAFNAAKSVVSFVADSLRALGSLIEKVAPALSDIGDAISWIPGLGKAGQGLKDLAGAMDDWPKGLNSAADAIENTLNPALQKGQDYTKAFIDRTKSATKFTEVLGKTIATVNDNGQIVLSDNSPEVGERLGKLGITIKELPDGTFTVDANTDEAKKILDDYRGQEQGKPIELPVKPTGTSAFLDDLQRQLAGNSVSVPVTGNPFNPGGVLGNVPTPGGPRKFAAGSAGMTGSEKGLNPNTIAAKRAVESQFPAITNIGGFRPPDGYNEHFRGEAIDVMIPNWGSPAGKAYGDQVAQYLLSNASALGVDYVLWQQRQWNADGTSSAMGDRKSPTANHMDHVHAHTVNTPQLPGAQSLKAGGGGGMRNFGPTDTPMVPGLVPPGQSGTISGLSTSIDTSGLTGAPSPSNAFGTAYQPGMGSAGYDQNGQPGYYQPDAEKINQANQRVQDAQEAIREADAAVAQARARQNELPYTAEESAKLSAAESVRAAEYRAQKARRELADTQTAFAEAQKGDFTKAKDAKKGGQGGMSGGGVGSIFSSFLKDTFGIGDFLPSLDNFWPLQAADTLISAFMPSQDPAAAGAGTSSAPFGIPDIAAPPMPDGNQHTGSGGMPGPGNVINIDQSQNFNNSPVGSDPAAVQKARDSAINRAPRLPVGMGG